VPIVAAAVCPHPPLLVPEVAAGAAAELDDLRAACSAAIDRLAAADPDALMIVGAAASGHAYGPGRWRLVRRVRRCQVTVDLGQAPAADSVLPLSLLIGAWLVARTRLRRTHRSALAVAAAATPAECLALGGRIDRDPARGRSW